MTRIAGTILVSGTSGTSSNSIHVLVALAGMLRKVYSSPEHATYVGVSFVETLLHDGIDERRSMEQHAFIRLVVVLFSDLLSSVIVAFPQFAVLYFLNL